MPKICESDGCNNPIWSRKTMRCKNHQPYKKKEFKVTKKEYKGLNDLSVDKEVELYKELWKMRPRVSFLSGIPINIKEGSNFWYNIFAHVLSKSQSKYPMFKLYSDNIIFLTPEEHMLLDHGSSGQREKYSKEHGCDWNKVYEYRDKMKHLYEATFSS